MVWFAPLPNHANPKLGAHPALQEQLTAGRLGVAHSHLIQGKVVMPPPFPAQGQHRKP